MDKNKTNEMLAGDRSLLHLFDRNCKQGHGGAYFFCFIFPLELLHLVLWNGSRPRERVGFLRDNREISVKYTRCTKKLKQKKIVQLHEELKDIVDKVSIISM